MLRKTVVVLLLTAITLNIGAGILYNGIPEEIKRLLPSPDLGEPGGSLEAEVPFSRSGDIYITSYNMSVDMERTSDGGETDTGSFKQYGTMTRSLNVEETLVDLNGIQEMRYYSKDTGELELRGDLTRDRRIYIDEISGTMAEERSTILETTGFIGSTPQVSQIDVDLKNARMSWEEILWRSMIPDNRTLSNGTSGSFNGRISMEELGVLLPDTKLEWMVRDTWEDVDGIRTLLEVSDLGDQDIRISLSVIFSDFSPIPLRIHLLASGTYPSDDGLVTVDLELKEELLDLFIGSGSVISWSIMKDSNEGDTTVSESLDGMVISQGGENSFWGTPRECMDLAFTDSVVVREFVDRFGEDSISMASSSYFKNDTGISGSRTWNITLTGPSNGGRSPACSFEVLVQSGGTGVIDRKKMDLISEREHTTFVSPDPDRNMISLSTYEDILRGSEHTDYFFISRQLDPEMVLEIKNRGDSGSGTLSTLIFNLMGLKREHAQDLFISHVPDSSDPMRYYILVVDGTRGEIISETEISGFTTLLINSFGLDLA